MTFQRRITLVTLLLCALFAFGKTAHAQSYLIDNTIRCSVPECIDITEGTLWYLSIEVTAVSVWNGNGINLDAFADVGANGCSVDVIGQVDGGAAISPVTGNEIGILAHAMGAAHRSRPTIPRLTTLMVPSESLVAENTPAETDARNYWTDAGGH